MAESGGAAASSSRMVPKVEDGKQDADTAKKNAEFCKEQCERFRKNALKDSRVDFLLRTMAHVGCPVKKHEYIQCSHCDEGCALTGGMKLCDDGNTEIHLCQNYLTSEDQAVRTLRHELIHSLDNCRHRVDWKNLRHLACAEIRASTLSGECDFWPEVLRGRARMKNHHQTCVRRRAMASIANFNGEELSELKGREAIADVFEVCYNDVYPFDIVP